jgi:phosphate transport system protein
MEVERSGDLVASVGRRVDAIESVALTSTVRALLRSMGDGAAAMFSSAAGAYAALDAEAAGRIPEQDDAMDALHRDLLRELFESSGPVASVVDLGLVARFYERIADHAVVIAERVRFVVDGSMNPGDADEQGWS